jgi:hypothetical protein
MYRHRHRYRYRYMHMHKYIYWYRHMNWYRYKYMWRQRYRYRHRYENTDLIGGSALDGGEDLVEDGLIFFCSVHDALLENLPEKNQTKISKKTSREYLHAVYVPREHPYLLRVGFDLVDGPVVELGHFLQFLPPVRTDGEEGVHEAPPLEARPLPAELRSRLGLLLLHRPQLRFVRNICKYCHWYCRGRKEKSRRTSFCRAR